ncbi:MAG: LamG-like jellyroll fold domain-containing protein [Nanobdellota archaeon]
MKTRAQTSVELIIIMAVTLVVLGSVVHLSNDSMGFYHSMIKQQKGKSLLNKLSSSAEMVYHQGYGSKTSVYVNVPKNVKNIALANKTITILYNTGSKQYRNFDFSVAGNIPAQEGGYWLEVESLVGMVVISTNSTNISKDYSTCGNNNKEIGEECDGSDLAGKSCSSFGYSAGELECVNCMFDTSNCSEAGSENCVDGIDNDGDGLVDCDDPNCIGDVGPNGGICCAGHDSECPGNDACVRCNSFSECEYASTETVCDDRVLCSFAGDNGYGKGGNVPSKGYCDGFGNCDYANISEGCSFEEGFSAEEINKDICVDGNADCVNTCVDGIDNDGDGCVDGADSDCNGTESRWECVDNLDNDCDGYIDCDDADCSGEVIVKDAFGPLPDNNYDERAFVSDGANMSENLLLFHFDQNPLVHASSIIDSSGSNNNGLLVTGEISSNKSVRGKVNKSLFFDGVDDYISVTNFSESVAGQDHSLFLWINTTSAEKAFITAFNSNDGDNKILFGKRAGSDTLQMHVGSYYDTSETIADGNWHYIGYVFDDSSDNFKVFVDGEVVSEFSSSVSISEDDLFNIGMDYDGSTKTDFWQGKIDEFAFWNRTLTEQEIMDNYNRVANCYYLNCTRAPACILNCSPVNPKGNLLRLHMDEEQWSGVNGEVNDSSGNSYDFTSVDGADTVNSGKIKRAGYFDGAGAHIIDEDAESYINGLDAFTLSMWVKSDETYTDNGFLYVREPSGKNDVLGIRYDRKGSEGGANNLIKSGITTTEGTTQIESESNIQSTDWQHLVLRWDSGGPLELFVDGQEASLSYRGPNLGGTITNANQFIIGRGIKDNNNDGWHGKIDEVYFWNRSISNQEIEDIYNEEKFCIEECPLEVVCEPENCTNGIDDNGNGLVDCMDSACFGKEGPNGDTCCGNDSSFCKGVNECHSCGTDHECEYASNSKICDTDFLCSFSGDEGYGQGGNVPSQGYCDGQGGCDYVAASLSCSLNESDNVEGDGQDICVDGYSSCVLTCEDGIDNDDDGCIDGVDSDCGGNETSCIDGIDNDCDGYVDCDDPDCSMDISCTNPELNCTNGLDDDSDGRIDCDDPDCIGKTGPNGGICCDGKDSNCPGDSSCKRCEPNNECYFYDNSKACNLNYRCSTGGDDGFDNGGNVPSQGYCDGLGNCDYAQFTPLCVINETNKEEGETKCVDGKTDCVNTCTDGIDNDNDGCIDYKDSDCGNTESECSDGLDNDCDGLVDCDDPDCELADNCLPPCSERTYCDKCIADGNCEWCDADSSCYQDCNTGWFQNCWFGTCHSETC